MPQPSTETDEGARVLQAKLSLENGPRAVPSNIQIKYMVERGYIQVHREDITLRQKMAL